MMGLPYEAKKRRNVTQGRNSFTPRWRTVILGRRQFIHSCLRDCWWKNHRINRTPTVVQDENNQMASGIPRSDLLHSIWRPFMHRSSGQFDSGPRNIACPRTYDLKCLLSFFQILQPRRNHETIECHTCCSRYARILCHHSSSVSASL